MSMGYFDPELDLLSDEPAPGEQTATASSHALRTAPILTGDVLDDLSHCIFPQRALYGRVIAQHTSSNSEPDEIVSPKLYINTNTPFSALVCGVQGSGKSHSTSVLLESCLINDGRIGTLPAPLSAIVPTYLKAMRRVYAELPVRVEPLLFSPEDISGERLLAMMKVDENAQMPLYMESIMAILRGMEDNFDYRDFRDQVGRAKFNGSQKSMLNLRLSLLDSCLNGDESNSIKSHFKAGQLTIIDLSSPFMDGASACGFFDIILGLFVEAEITAGKVVVLDEAHKYLSESQAGSSGRLTDSLLTIIRQQRHLATRVVISTQEPTVVPSKFLDLCSIIIAHRFSSPKWLKTLAQHVSAADSSLNELFDKIVSLQTGQAILFAPNGLCVRSRAAAASASSWQAETEAEQPHNTTTTTVGMLGQGYFLVRSRLRLTLDGGHSLLAVTTPGMSTRLGRVSGRGQGSEADAPPRHLPTPIPSPDSSSRFAAPSTHSVPTSNINTTRTTQPIISVSARVTAPSQTTQSGSRPSAKQQVNMKAPAYQRYKPLLKYVAAVCNDCAFVRLSTLVKHFKNKKPGVYGKDDRSIESAVASAIQLGILVRIDAEGQHIAINRGITYS
ncbi:hypothetical protein EIP86_001967 [Pleurotus ostreatoroseus]|nr:hypothetical protein EIP86_001967 [Pleurotus ostreatoroseus]